MINRAGYFVLAMLVSLSSASARDLSVPAFLTSLASHHPKLLELDAKAQQRHAELAAATAAFDLQIEQESALRLQGYYDGNALTQRIVKPLPMANAKLKAEYRVAEGNFPYYEGQLDTLSGGEASVGVSLSLLQNRDTDKKRMAINDARVSLNQWEASEALALNTLFYQGLSAYLNWYEAHLTMKVYEQLLNTSHQRREAIAKRVDAGDLASIALTEFDATVIRREVALNSAQQKAMKTRLYLGFYFRDPSFKPLEPQKLQYTPMNIQWPWELRTPELLGLINNVKSHPYLAQLDTKLRLAKNKTRLARNATLPTLDVEAKMARDLGSGPQNLIPTETKLGIQFSMPLGQRQAKARLSKQQQVEKEIEMQIQLQQDALERDIQNAVQTYRFTQSLMDKQQKQATLAEELFLQEQKRFRIGASDLFVLNTREAYAINSRLDAINTEIEVMRASLGVLYYAGILPLKTKEYALSRSNRDLQ